MKRSVEKCEAVSKTVQYMHVEPSNNLWIQSNWAGPDDGNVDLGTETGSSQSK